MHISTINPNLVTATPISVDDTRAYRFTRIYTCECICIGFINLVWIGDLSTTQNAYFKMAPLPGIGVRSSD